MSWNCKNCGSTNVEIRVWYKPNEQEVVVKDLTTINDDEVWCHDCDGGGFGIKKVEEKHE
jgi:hypothetical protein